MEKSISFSAQVFKIYTNFYVLESRYIFEYAGTLKNLMRRRRPTSQRGPICADATDGPSGNDLLESSLAGMQLA